jgi:hypothetical protein
VFGSTLEEAKQLYSIDSKKILCQIRIAPAASAPGKKVEQRGRSTFFLEYLKKCSKNPCFKPPHETGG